MFTGMTDTVEIAQDKTINATPHSVQLFIDSGTFVFDATPGCEVRMQMVAPRAHVVLTNALGSTSVPASANGWRSLTTSSLTARLRSPRSPRFAQWASMWWRWWF